MMVNHQSGSNVFVMDHPLVRHKIGLIRDKDTGTKDFRETISEIAGLICYEATRGLKLDDVEVETPLCTTKVKRLGGKKLVIAPIMRAGEGMLGGVLSMIPAAKVAHVGIFRDHDTLEPIEYFFKAPPDCAEREIFILDPMLATGGSAIAAINSFKQRGCQSIHFLCIIAAPEGIKRLTAAHPDVELYIGEVDDHLNEYGYIVPGLGDAGDRIYGTK